jgi:chromosome segregation ATPase
MTPVHNFRSAFHGFNREDVVRYIEYQNTKHTDLVNQLRNENKALLEELNALRSATAQADTNLAAQLEEVTAQRDAALAELEQLRAEAAAAPSVDLAKEELEAYRRAEQAERAAKERAAQLYRQATGTLADATVHVDTAAGQFRQIAERVNTHMNELQAAVESSKNALLEASDILCAIRPEGPEE